MATKDYPLIGFIYLVTNRVNGKQYVGQTVHSIAGRFNCHIKRTGRPLGKAIQKYGVENFSIRVIDTAVSRSWLDRKEQTWIEFYHSQAPKGYNLSLGGYSSHGFKMSEEAKAKIASALKGRKLSESHILATANANRGRKRSIESRQKMSESAKRVFRNPEYNHPMLGRKHSLETRRRLSQSHLGQVPWNKGKKASPEVCRKLSQRMRGNIPWNKGKKVGPIPESQRQLMHDRWAAGHYIAARGWTQTEEAKAKIAEASRNMWAKRRGISNG
jgi:group I intron endonuclease